VCGLRVDDVDFLRRAVHVRRQVQLRDGAPVELPPKSRASERTVPVDSDVLDLVAALVTPGQGYVVTRSKGRSHTPRTLYSAWVNACAAADVEGFTLHDARHFYASGLIASGLDVVAVSHALGHHSPTVTLSTYAHLWPSAEDVTRQASGRLLAAVMGGSDSVDGYTAGTQEG
jgi:integrase